MIRPKHTKTRPGPSRGTFLLGIPALLVAACSGDSSSGGSTPDIYTVKRDSLPIRISESAELKAQNETRIKSEVEGQATVIYLIEEGIEVEAGEKLVELDVSELVDRRANQAIAVERANAALINEQENMKILEKEIRADEKAAESTLEIAGIDLDKFLGEMPLTVPASDIAGPEPAPGAGTTEGGTNANRGTNGDMVRALREQVAGTQYEHLVGKVVDVLGTAALDRDMGESAQQILTQIDKIALADQELVLNADKYDKSRGLALKNYITKNTLEEDRLRFKRSESQVTLAWNDLDLLASYQLRKDKIDLKLKLDNAKLELEKVRASAAAKRARGEADLSSQDAEYKLATERLQNLETQIKNAVLRAPTPGLVVYATQGDGRRGRETVEEGTSVRDRQTLIVLPDLRHMTAELKIQESDINKVQRGQKAVITVDTFADKVFTGRVSRVSALADSGSRWSNNNLKVYKTWVEVEGENTELRPNMTARVEILVGRKDDVLAVPLTAVRRQGAVHYVWKKTGDGPAAKRVGIGANNLTQVEIVEGVAEGDQIYLAPPPGSDAPEFQQPEKPKADTEIPSGEPDSERRTAGQGGAESVMTAAKFQALVTQKLPQFAEVIKTDRRALYSNAELRAAIEADAELQEASEALRAQMMKRFRNGGGEGRPDGGGGGRGRPGGEGRRGPGERRNG